MAEEENMVVNNTIPDSVFEELEKISKMEKSVKRLNMRANVMLKSIDNIRKEKEEQKNLTGEEDPQTDKENVIEKDKLSPTLKTDEKKRYAQIGKEFLKGARVHIEEMQKALQLKEKMSTSKIKEDIKKQEEKTEEKKKSKLGIFTKIGILLGSFGLLYVLFEDKIKKFFPDFSVSFAGLTDGIGNVFDKMGEIFFNIIGVSFGNTFGTFITSHLPGLITNFFYYVLPASLERAVFAVMSNFSEDARKRYESGTVSFQLNFNAARARYDLASAQRTAREDFVKLTSGLYSETEALAARRRAYSGAFVEYDSSRPADAAQTTDLVSQIMGQAVFGIDTSSAEGLSEVKKYIFNDNHPIARTLIAEMSENDALLRRTIADGLTEDEIRTVVAPMIAKSAGIKTDGTDVRYTALVLSLLSSLGSDASVAALRMNSLIGVVGKYQEVIEGEERSAVRAANEATALERTGALARVLIGGVTPTATEIKLLSDSVVEAEIAAEVHDFYTKISEFYKNPEDVTKQFVTNMISFSKQLFSEFLGKSFNLFNSIIENIPLFFRGSQLDYAVGRLSSFSANFNAGDWNTFGQELFQTALGGETQRAIVVVNLSLGSFILDNISKMAQIRKDTLNKLEETNSELVKIVGLIQDKTRLNEGVNLKSIEDRLLELNSETTRLITSEFQTVNGRIENIENYLEANDRDEGEKGKDDFVVLQSL